MHLIEKSIGETPLQALERLRAEQGISPDEPLSYAGRLDPMASGALLVLEGDETRDRERFLGLDKEYEVEVLLGTWSDTGDVLGIVSEAPLGRLELPLLERAGTSLVGAYDAPYPAFSSKTVRGKSLFAWALEGRLDEVEIPRQHGTIRSLEVTGLDEVRIESLREQVLGKLALAPEGFRAHEARDSWEQLFASTARPAFPVARMTVLASSGTYMRTLADDLARGVGTRGLALSIHRTRIVGI